MPIEILELVVKASVDNTDQVQGPIYGSDDINNNGQAGISNEERSKIVREAVEEILAIIHRERDR